MSGTNGNSNGNADAVLTRDQILAAAQQVTVDVAPLVVKELGGLIYVKGMSGKERDRTEEAFRVKHGRRTGQFDMRNFRAFMAARVIVGATGDRLLNDQDADMLGRLPSGVLDRIIGKANELSGGTDEEIDDLGNASANEAVFADSASLSRSN